MDSVQLNKGDYVVLITDGIIEAKSSQNVAYSLERTINLLSRKYDSSEDVVEKLLHDVKTFAEDTDQHDDLTVLTFKWN